MQKLLTYVCNELDELEKRLDQGTLSFSDIQYGDILAHFKKNLLTGDAMMKKHSGRYEGNSYGHDGYDNNSYDYDDRSRDGRMSRRMSRDEAKDDLIRNLRGIMRSSNDEEVKNTIKRWISETEY